MRRPNSAGVSSFEFAISEAASSRDLGETAPVTPTHAANASSMLRFLLSQHACSMTSAWFPPAAELCVALHRDGLDSRHRRSVVLLGGGEGTASPQTAAGELRWR